MSFNAYAKEIKGHEVFVGQLVTDIDEGALVSYYGSVSPRDSWCIRQLTSTTLLYAFGKGDYPAAWADRANLTYARPNDF